MKLPTSMSLLRFACGFAIVGLGFMMWSLFDPRPPPILLALSLGQVIGTLSLVVYVVVIVRDYRGRQRAAPGPVNSDESD